MPYECIDQHVFSNQMAVCDKPARTAASVTLPNQLKLLTRH